MKVVQHQACSSFDQFDPYIKISYGGVRDKTTERAMEKIGKIIKRMAAAR